MKASIEHRIMWFLDHANKKFDGISIKNTQQYKNEMVVFESFLTCKWVNKSHLYPTDSFILNVNKLLQKYFEVPENTIGWNNIKTMFWINLEKCKGELI